jgi:hypothetical protein
MKIVNSHFGTFDAVLKWASPYHHASVFLAGIQPISKLLWMPAKNTLA